MAGACSLGASSEFDFSAIAVAGSSRASGIQTFVLYFERDEPGYAGGVGQKDPACISVVFFLGWTGAHRYYVGKIGTGILMLFTGGVFGVLWLIDFIMIIVGAFTDSSGSKLTEWT